METKAGVIIATFVRHTRGTNPRWCEAELRPTEVKTDCSAVHNASLRSSCDNQPAQIGWISMNYYYYYFYRKDVYYISPHKHTFFMLFVKEGQKGRKAVVSDVEISASCFRPSSTV